MVNIDETRIRKKNITFIVVDVSKQSSEKVPIFVRGFSKTSYDYLFKQYKIELIFIFTVN